MSYTVKLPKGTQEYVEYTVEDNSIIIIGANGSGKSSIGIAIEKRAPLEVHRIGAQKALIFEKYIPQKSYEQAAICSCLGMKLHNEITTVDIHMTEANIITYRL